MTSKIGSQLKYLKVSPKLVIIIFTYKVERQYTLIPFNQKFTLLSVITFKLMIPRTCQNKSYHIKHQFFERVIIGRIPLIQDPSNNVFARLPLETFISTGCPVTG